MIKKRSLDITGSSNLNLKSLAWEKIKKYFNLKFGNYGDIHSYLSLPAHNDLIIVFCLKDVIDFSKSKIENKKKLVRAKIYAYIMPRSLDIDNMKGFKLASLYLKLN